MNKKKLAIELSKLDGFDSVKVNFEKNYEYDFLIQIRIENIL